MKVVGTHNQQPTEVKKYRLNYARWLDTSYNQQIGFVYTDVTELNNSTGEVLLPTLSVDVNSFSSDSTVVDYTISGGVDGIHYRVEFTMNTAVGTQGEASETKIDYVDFRIRTL